MDISLNLKVTNILDKTFDLNNNSYKPFKEDNSA